MDEKMQSIYKNQIWDLIPLPLGNEAITAKWVYKTKPSLDGAAPRLKAFLVIRGFEQRCGIDFEETFAPISKRSTIHVVTAHVAQLSHKIHHLDIITTFLYGLIKKKVFMQQPQGYKILGHPTLVY